MPRRPGIGCVSPGVVADDAIENHHSAIFPLLDTCHERRSIDGFAHQVNQRFRAAADRRQKRYFIPVA